MTTIRVIVVGDHPHKGKAGTLTGKVIRPLGREPEMAEVKFDDAGSVDGCFAEARNLRKIESEAE